MSVAMSLAVSLRFFSGMAMGSRLNGGKGHGSVPMRCKEAGKLAPLCGGECAPEVAASL